jgi:hypothetical protein
LQGCLARSFVFPEMRQFIQLNKGNKAVLLQ